MDKQLERQAKVFTNTFGFCSCLTLGVIGFIVILAISGVYSQ